VLTAELSDLEAGILKQVIPDMDTLLGRPIPDAPEMEGQVGQQRLLNSITLLFYRQTSPVLLLLEDLQWAAESLDVLKQLQRVVEERPLLIVGDYRDDEQPDLPQALPGAQGMKLERLTAHSMAELCTAILGEAGQTEAVLTLLQRETEGNAFFVVEVVRALAEEAGRLNEIAMMALPEQVFPQGIQTIIQRRLDRVPPSAQKPLQFAAAVGRQLDLRLLIHSNHQPSLEQWLTTCANAAVLEIRDGQWQFAHDKLREGLLSSLDETTLVSLHRQVALAIEKVYPDNGEYAAALMRHWGVVGDRNRELHYARWAGEHAATHYANTEAITFFNRALTLVDADDPITHYELLLAREKVHDLQGNREAQQQDIEALAVLTHRFKYPNPLLAEISLRLSNYAEAVSDYMTAVAAAKEAVRLAQSTQLVEMEAEGYLHWGRVLWRQARYADAREQLEQALKLARRARQSGQKSVLGEVEAQSLRNLGIISALQSDHENARQHFSNSLHLFREINDQRGESGALNNLGIISKGQGDFDGAYAYYQDSLRLCQEIGDRWGESIALLNLGALDLHQGQMKDAGRTYERTLRLSQQIGNSYAETLSLANLGLLFHRLGENEKAETYCRQSLAQARALGARGEQGFALTILGHALVGMNQLDAAAAAYQEALALRRELGQPNLAMEPLAGLARMELVRGDYVAALTPIEEILAHLETSSLAGTDEPYRVYLTCFKVLQANGDLRARAILQTGHRLLQEQAAKIKDETRRHSLLQNVPDHREMIALVAQ